MVLRPLLLLLPLLLEARPGPAQPPARKASFFASVAPNLVLGQRRYERQQGPAVYLREQSALGAGLHLGYLQEARRWYASACLQLAEVRSGVQVDFSGSGFVSRYQYQPAASTYSFSYGPLVGLALQGGWRRDLGAGTLLAGGGLHLHYFPDRTTSRGIRLSPESASLPRFYLVYLEQPGRRTRFAPGADLQLQYALRIGGSRPFAGLHFSYSPEPIRGRYDLFPGESFGSTGTFSLRRSYLSLQLGLLLGRS